MNKLFFGRLGLIQRVLPSYRVPFFDLLAEHCSAGLALFAGEPLPQEGILNGQPAAARLTSAHNLHFFNPQHPLYLCYQNGLIPWLERENPAGLVVEANFRYLSSPPAVQWMKLRRRPVIGWGLGAPLSRGGLSYWRNQFLRRFDALIAYSQRGAEEYAACGFPMDKIFVAANSVARAPVHPMPERPPLLPAQPPSILFVGRLQARKRAASLIEACARLPIRPRLVIVGDGPELESLQARAHDIYPAAEFPGALRGPDLAPYFLAADLFVLPGTGGLAVQEAMSYGLPVMVARGDGTQDDLVRPANGWLLPPDDDEALISTLRDALKAPQRFREMGQESYRIVSEEINLERMVAVFLQALRAVS